MAERLVIVSNRVPLAAPSALDDIAAPALGALANDAERVLWFGWSGRLSDDPGAHVMRASGFRAAATFVGVDLSETHYEGYLNGFSNSTLWPLFHDMPDRIRFHAEDLVSYRAVNAHFAAHLAPLLRAGDRIWVQDYHLIPLAALLRQAGVTNPIGLFLHVPFPSPSGLLAWPWHKKLATDFAAYDLVGFQTRRDDQNFDAFMRAATARFATGSRSAGPRAMPTTGVFPTGLHTRLHMASAASADTDGRVKRLGAALCGRPLIISADRLDYTKGLLERLRAYECLLDETHEHRGASTFVQVTAPSRPLVPGYIELRMEQQSAVERINSKHLTRGWMPVLDIYANLPPRSLAALHRLGRVGLATPLRDGVNLAAKEYVAAQNPHDPGCLILSRFAGADELLSEAVLVDPSDLQEMTNALRTALRMPHDERQDRWRRMIVKLLHHDALAWHQSYVAALAHAHKADAMPGRVIELAPTSPQGRPRPGRAPQNRILSAPSTARRVAVRAKPIRALRPGVA